MSERATRTLVGAVALLAVASCGDAFGVPDPPRDLAEAQQRWRRQRPAAYHLTLTVSCFCGFVAQPVVVEVRGDSVISRRVRDTDTPLDPRLAASFPSVDALFEIVVRARAQNAELLDVSYDPALGYPTRVAIDYRARVADDEIQYTVVAFEPR